MTETESAYLAGLIDGEGCIQARPHGDGGWIRPSIEVCMTNPAPLRWAVEKSGAGRLYECQPDRRGDRRQAWKWIISATQEAATVLRRLTRSST